MMLRRMGWLCRKPRPHKYVLKISHTIIPEGGTTPLKAARNVFIQNKLAMVRGCKFDATTETCQCGFDIDQFLEGCKMNTVT